ncbi:hypothetical protein [Algibacillus agarilyticus]|uniref:hypothetical protein n=1 Tax=Algibacillus agarilyticus TaxID=2234133 RepID=UPI000DCFCE12|nr:hypothetical protein [Algibacillus agarilyticus]
MFKIIALVVFSLFSLNSYACFQPPPGLTELHESQAKFYFLSAIVLLVISIGLRLTSNRNRVWVPLLFIATFTYFPAYLWHWGQMSGSCGRPEIVFAFQVFAAGMLFLSVYEAIKFYKQKKLGKIATIRI